MKDLSSKAELNFLKALFFLFAFLIMSWIPRFPEVKRNLGMSNGEFGSIISCSAFGAVAALLTVGHLAHNYGVKPVIRIATVLIVSSLILLTSTQSSVVFLISMIVQGASIAAFHISINTQGFDFQDRTKSSVIILLSGWWSSGALITAVISGSLINRISISTHILILSLICLFLIWIIIFLLNESFVKSNLEKEHNYKISDVVKGFQIDKLASSAWVCAIYLEYAIHDWAAIYAKEDTKILSGLHTLPYILFSLTMIIGRLNVHLFYSRFSMQFLMSVGSIVAGVSFILGIFFTRLIAPENQLLQLIVLSFSFALTGLGSSFLSPSIMDVAKTRSSLPASVVIGQIGVINNIAVFAMRVLIAWTAQVFSLSIALMIPALMVLTIPYFSKIFRQT